VRGWEALAGVIERTRRFDFANSLAETYDSNRKTQEDAKGTCLNGDNPKNIARDDTLPSSPQCSDRSPRTHPHINQLTINEYTPGQGIGSHVDTETAFDDGLLIITLNGGIVMEFRKVTTAPKDDAEEEKKDANGGRKLLYLPPRSLVLLSGDARYEWENMIVSRTTDTVDGVMLPRKLRVSLTLRTALTAPREGWKTSPLPPYESSAFPPRGGQPSDASRMTSDRKRNESNGDHALSDQRSDLLTPDTESRHVHDVYDAIATQWHHTRGKRGVLWPGASRFLEGLPKGSVVADVGCGDGKYFPAIWASDSYVIGTDISEPLLKMAAATADEGYSARKGAENGPQHQRLSDNKRSLSVWPAVAVPDCIHVPLRDASCDAAICIAVMHHLSTEGRRVRCLSELARIVKPGGTINVQAWALKQEYEVPVDVGGGGRRNERRARERPMSGGSEGEGRRTDDGRAVRRGRVRRQEEPGRLSTILPPVSEGRARGPVRARRRTGGGGELVREGQSRRLVESCVKFFGMSV